MAMGYANHRSLATGELTKTASDQTIFFVRQLDIVIVELRKLGSWNENASPC